MLNYIQNKWRNYDRTKAKHHPALVDIKDNSAKLSEEEMKDLLALTNEDALAELTRS